jgi:hypothetical protein
VSLKKHKKTTTFDGLCFTVTINGVALDLTNIEINAHFRLGSKTGCKVHKFSVGNGIEKTDSVNGQFSLLEGEIINWEVGDWYFDIKFTWLSGRVEIYYENILPVVQNITQ